MFFRALFWIENDNMLMKATNDGGDPEMLALLPIDASSDNDLIIRDGYIYVVSSDNKRVYKVSMKRKNHVFEEPLIDSSIQKVCF